MQLLLAVGVISDAWLVSSEVPILCCVKCISFVGQYYKPHYMHYPSATRELKGGVLDVTKLQRICTDQCHLR